MLGDKRASRKLFAMFMKLQDARGCGDEIDQLMSEKEGTSVSEALADAEFAILGIPRV